MATLNTISDVLIIAMLVVYIGILFYSAINDNKILIGLSEEEVVELLGEPRHKYTDIEYKENYSYDAGATFKKSLFKNNYGRKVYDLHIDFDAEGKVIGTNIQQIP